MWRPGASILPILESSATSSWTWTIRPVSLHRPPPSSTANLPYRMLLLWEWRKATIPSKSAAMLCTSSCGWLSFFIKEFWSDLKCPHVHKGLWVGTFVRHKHAVVCSYMCTIQRSAQTQTLVVWFQKANCRVGKKSWFINDTNECLFYHYHIPYPRYY